MVSAPSVVLRGIARNDWLASAWTSTRSGRVPSTAGKTIVPDVSPERSDRNSPEGSATSESPVARISNTPISFVDPNRFFTAFRIRYGCPFSPSK